MFAVEMQRDAEARSASSMILYRFAPSNGPPQVRWDSLGCGRHQNTDATHSTISRTRRRRGRVRRPLIANRARCALCRPRCRNAGLGVAPSSRLGFHVLRPPCMATGRQSPR